MSWKTSTIDHDTRIRMGLSMNDYVLLDYIYRTQTHPDYGGRIGGWCETTLDTMSEFFGISKGGLSGIIKKLESDGFIELLGNKRRTTGKWFSQYRTTVQKMNSCSESEQTCSESEQDTLVYKEEIKDLRPNPNFPPTLKEKKAGQGVQPLNNEDDADSVENTLSDDIKRAMSRTDLKARIKHVLDAKWNQDLPKLYGRSKQNLASDALDAMMASGFVGNDNTAIGNWIRKFVTNRSKISEQKSFPPEVTAIVEDLIRRTLNVGPYNKLMQPLRDFEKTKMAEWVESKPGIHHWHAFDTLIDLFSKSDSKPEFLTVSNALSKYAEDNKEDLKMEYNKRLKRVGLK